MTSFFKRFGLGIVYVVSLPFLLLGLVLFAIWGIINFLVNFFISIINFFRGKKFLSPLKEDELAKKILLERKEAKLQQEAQPAPQPQPQVTTNTTENHNENVVNFSGATINIIQTNPNQPIDPNQIMNGIAQATTPLLNNNKEPEAIPYNNEQKPIEPEYKEIGTGEGGENNA